MESEQARLSGALLHSNQECLMLCRSCMSAVLKHFPELRHGCSRRLSRDGEALSSNWHISVKAKMPTT